MFRNLPQLPTFKSLPSAIGLPFLSSQEDAQLKFRSGEGGIKRLYGDETIPLSDFGYWAQYYTLFNSAQDVYSLITVQDIRQALSANPTNLANLLLNLSHHLFTLLPSSLFPTNSSTPSQQDTTKEALNCLRVLGRVIVVVYEAEADRLERSASGGPGVDGEESFAGRWLWRRMKMDEVRMQGREMGDDLEPEPKTEGKGKGKGKETAEVEIEGEQFTIEDSDEEEEEGDGDGDGDEGARAFKAVIGNPPQAETETETTANGPSDPLSSGATHDPHEDEVHDALDNSDDTLPSLVDRLFSCTIDLLFCAGFTLPESVRSQSAVGDRVNYVIWEKGIGSTVSVGSSAELDRNKSEVLRFLMILLSSTIYTPPHLLHSSPNLPLQNLTHTLERRLVLSLLCSFLNTSLSSSKTNAGMTGQLPYNHLISNAAEERRGLVRGCMMTLLVALDYREPEGGRSGGGEMGEAKDDNAFRYFVSKLHRKEDFSFILGGILAILEEQSNIMNGYLPGSKKPVPYILNTYMLLWRIVDLNKRFRAYLFDSGKAVDVTVYILLCCLELKDDPAHHGLLRLLSYLLQTLSADKAFALALNQTIRLPVPTKWAVAGTAADFLIVSVYSIATTPGLNPLFPALTISVANVAPYLTNIGVQASTRLMQLFKAFSAPNFILADEGHPRLIYYILETINSILYHQFNHNPNFVYAVLRSHQDFQTLATFTLMSGLRDIQKRKAKLAAAESRKDDAKALQRTNSELDMIAEKTALLAQSPEENIDLDEPSTNTPGPLPQPLMSPEAGVLPLVTPGDIFSANNADPLNKSPAPAPAAAAATPPLSEKARGKMRATESTASLQTLGGGGGGGTEQEIPDEELLRVAAAGVGPNGYVPTQEWVTSWQKGLPLDPVLLAISELLPKIQDTTRPSGAPSSKVFNLLKEMSLVDVLPPAPPIVPRRFQWSPASAIWLTSLLWGDIYVAGLTTVGVWKDTKVRLFGVKTAPVKGRSAQVGRVLKMMGVV